MTLSAMSLDRSPWARARWLVLAPHQDDETLGAGALIAETAAAGRLAAIAYLTDGAGSHPASCRGLRGIRRREARIAVRRLCGAAPVRIVGLGWADARPLATGTPAFARSCARLAAFLRREAIDAIAVTAGHEPHCDHAAAYAVAVAAARAARRDVALFQYHVWSTPPARARAVVRTKRMPPGVRRSALQAHRSQLSPLFGPGFRLHPDRRGMPAADLLYRSRA